VARCTTFTLLVAYLFCIIMYNSERYVQVISKHIFGATSSTAERCRPSRANQPPCVDFPVTKGHMFEKTIFLRRHADNSFDPENNDASTVQNEASSTVTVRHCLYVAALESCGCPKAIHKAAEASRDEYISVTVMRRKKGTEHTRNTSA
jgi:hypothetical protein